MIDQQPTGSEDGDKNYVKEAFKDDHERAIMTNAYQEAIRIRNQDLMNPDNFTDTYDPDLLKRCADYVERRESEIAQQGMEDSNLIRAEVFGKTLEGILHDVIQQGAFGESVRSVATSKYDDFHAGIDEILERRTEDGTTQIGCALDFTFGKPDKKIGEIIADIENGKQREVLFYESPFGNPPEIHGRLQGIPRMIVGLDANHIVQISEQWQNDLENAKSSQLFLLILRQITLQADVFSEIARSNNQPEIRAKYEQVRDSISKLYTELRLERQINFLDDSVTNDLVFKGIKQNLDELMAK